MKHKGMKSDIKSFVRKGADLGNKQAMQTTVIDLRLATAEL